MNIINTIQKCVLTVLKPIEQSFKMPNPTVFISLFGILVSFMLPLVLFLIQKSEDSKEATAWMHLVTRKLVNFKTIWISILTFLCAEFILLCFEKNIYVCILAVVIILLCFVSLIIQLSYVIRWLADDHASGDENSYQNRVQKEILTKYKSWNDFKKNWEYFYSFLSTPSSSAALSKTSLFYEIWKEAYYNIHGNNIKDNQQHFIQDLILSYDKIKLSPMNLNTEFLKYCINEYNTETDSSKLTWNNLINRQVRYTIKRKDIANRSKIIEVVQVFSEFIDDKYEIRTIRSIASLFFECIDLYEGNLPNAFKITSVSLTESNRKNASWILMNSFFQKFQNRKPEIKNDCITKMIFPKSNPIILGKIYFALNTISKVNLSDMDDISDKLFDSIGKPHGFGEADSDGFIEDIDDKERQIYQEDTLQKENESINVMLIYYSRTRLGRSNLFLNYLNKVINILNSNNFIERSKLEHVNGDRNYCYHLLIKLRDKITESNR